MRYVGDKFMEIMKEYIFTTSPGWTGTSKQKWEKQTVYTDEQGKLDLFMEKVYLTQKQGHNNP